MALLRTLSTPTYYLHPSSMVEVCLVLAPAVNFFLNSRKQGLPCWRSLSFFLSFFLSNRDSPVYVDQGRGLHMVQAPGKFPPSIWEEQMALFR